MRKYINNLRERWREWEQEEYFFTLFGFLHIETDNHFIQVILLVLIAIATALIFIF